MSEAYRYVAAEDGSEVAYRVRGTNKGPALVLTNGFTTSDFYWRDMITRFQDRAQLITWDLKGHGRSGPAKTRESATIPAAVDDLRRVMDDAGIERGVLLGFSLGCQIVLEAWRHIPDRIQAIVPILGTYGKPFDNLVNPHVGRLAFSFFKLLGKTAPGPILKGAFLGTRMPMMFELNQLAGMIGKRVSREDMQPFFDHLGMMDGPTWAAMGMAAQEHTTRDILPNIEVPTLVVAGGRDTFTPPSLGEHMHEAIPDSELLFLPEATHTGLFEFPDEIAEALSAFLHKHQLLTPTAHDTP